MNAQSPGTPLQEIVGVLFVALGALLLVSLISYDPKDPSLFSVSSNPAVHNLAGRVGASLADFLFQWIGGGAYVVSVGALALGWHGLIQKMNRLRPRILVGFVFLLLLTPIVLELWFWALPSPVTGWVLQGHPGGVAGRLFKTWLMDYFNLFGAYLLVLAGTASALMLTFSVSPVAAAAASGRALRWSGTVFGHAMNEYQRLARRWQPPVRIHPRPSEEKPRILSSTPPDLPSAAPTVAVPKQASFEFVKPVGPYRRPPLGILSDPPENRAKASEEELVANSRILEKKLSDFDVEGRVTQVHPGPVVTMYEYEPAPGVKINQIVNLSDDLALAMRAVSVRIVAPIPGKSAVGVEIPNNRRQDVYLKEVLPSEPAESGYRLPLALGKDIFGNPIVTDLSTMPHLLVAGATGSGKSVALNSMILSLLFSATPDEVKFIMMDPKLLELSAYDGIPHLMAPVITRSKEMPAVFLHLVAEMQNRYRLLAEAGVRNIEGYNARIRERPIAAETPITQDAPASPPSPLPYLVVIVDELADLMAVAMRETEESMARLAQMARAAGIHLIVATQRPSVDVLTGVIKANFPARIAFQVSSKTDSRTILDANGAEQLLGRGDMLFLSPGTGRIVRIHGAYVSEPDIEKVVGFVKIQAKPRYVEILPKPGSAGGDSMSDRLSERDELYEKAVEMVTHSGLASASLIQRRLRVGYPRAARMIEMMEEDGLVGPASGGKPREVLTRPDRMIHHEE